MPLYQQDSSINGSGLFCTSFIKKGDVIISYRKDFVVSNDELQSYKDQDRAIQIYPNYYLPPNDHLESYVNHSCNPNSGLRIVSEIYNGKPYLKSVDLIALDSIIPNIEITFDYSTTQLDKNWSMNCACGNHNCRKLISDCSTLTLTNVLKYWWNNVIPNYAIKGWFNVTQKFLR